VNETFTHFAYNGTKDYQGYGILSTGFAHEWRNIDGTD
jgi:hypothetical protein